LEYNMTRYTLKEMFDKSRELWTLKAQILMLVEECNELSVTALHLIRNLKHKETPIEQFAEEVADVQFMIDEMLYYFKLVPMVAKYRRMKEKRLETRLLEWEGKI